MNVFQRYLAKGDKTYYGRFTGPDPEDPTKRTRFLRNLGTEDKAKAIAKLRKLHKAAQEGRWEEIDSTKLRHEAIATMGEIKAIYDANTADLARCSRKNSWLSLALILRSAGVTKRTGDVTADELTGSLVTGFLQGRLRAAGEDKVKQQRAKITANSYVQQARSIFGKRFIPLYKEQGLHLPDLRGFMDAPKLKIAKAKYRMPDQALEANTVAAMTKLKQEDPQAYVACLLAYGIGLRKNEILHARWSWISMKQTTNGPRRILQVQTTADFAPKGRDDRDLPVEDHIHQQLQSLHITNLDAEENDFILQTPAPRRKWKKFADRVGRKNPTAAANVFRRIGQWMKGLGWTSRKKAHELRKLFGAHMATKHGLYTSQILLGHKDPRTTSDYYSDLAKLPEIRMFG